MLLSMGSKLVAGKSFQACCLAPGTLQAVSPGLRPPEEVAFLLPGACGYYTPSCRSRAVTTESPSCCMRQTPAARDTAPWGCSCPAADAAACLFASVPKIRWVGQSLAVTGSPCGTLAFCNSRHFFVPLLEETDVATTIFDHCGHHHL